MDCTSPAEAIACVFVYATKWIRRLHFIHIIHFMKIKTDSRTRCERITQLNARNSVLILMLPHTLYLSVCHAELSLIPALKCCSNVRSFARVRAIRLHFIATFFNLYLWHRCDKVLFKFLFIMQFFRLRHSIFNWYLCTRTHFDWVYNILFFLLSLSTRCCRAKRKK